MTPTLASLSKNRVLLPVLAIVSVVLVILAGVFGTAVNVIILGIVVFISVFYISYRYPRFNVLFLLAAAFFLPFLIKAFYLYELPVGMATEALCFVIVLTLIFNNRLSGIKSLPGILLLIWIFYLLIEVLNPNSSSRIASFSAIRGLIPMFLVYFIMYSSVSTKRDMYIFLGGWFVISLCAALYGLFQEFLGLPSFDMAWATFDETLYQMLFTWGRLRKFSFFFSPSEFGMLMSLAAVAAFIVFFFAKKRAIKIVSIIACLCCTWAMIYTGSRTAMVLLPAGFALFAMVTLHRKVLIATACIGVLGTILMIRPSSNQALFVMSTAFSGADDPSMNVRLMNQERIRGYIISNPIGFGLGSTGYLGAKYSPHTFIGTFPPDSEYVKIAIEAGWIGLFFWCVILAIVFGFGVNVYFKTRDPEWRLLVLVSLVVLFMVIVGQYPQEIFFASQAISILFSGAIGLLARIDHIVSKSHLKDNPDENC